MKIGILTNMKKAPPPPPRNIHTKFEGNLRRGLIGVEKVIKFTMNTTTMVTLTH